MLFSAVLPLTPVPPPEQLLQYGIWGYALVFLVVMFAATVIGGWVPNNTFLFLTGAVAKNSDLSMVLVFIVGTLGGIIGYEINYRGGKLFGLAIDQGVRPAILKNETVIKALNLMDRYGPVALLLSRFLPVMNLPSFIAAVNGMEHRKYLVFNIISAAIWCGTDLLLGYYVGSIPFVNGYVMILANIFFIILAAVVIIAMVLFLVNRLRKNRWNPAE